MPEIRAQRIDFLEAKIVCLGLMDLDTNKVKPLNVGDPIDDTFVKRIEIDSTTREYLLYLASRRVFVLSPELVKWHIKELSHE